MPQFSTGFPRLTQLARLSNVLPSNEPDQEGCDVPDTAVPPLVKVKLPVGSDVGPYDACPVIAVLNVTVLLVTPVTVTVSPLRKVALDSSVKNPVSPTVKTVVRFVGPAYVMVTVWGDP